MTEHADLLRMVGEAYQEVKRSSRQLRLDDRLREDLDLDSLDAIDILTLLEDRLGIELVDDGGQNLEKLATVGSFLGYLEGRL